MDQEIQLRKQCGLQHLFIYLSFTQAIGLLSLPRPTEGWHPISFQKHRP
jgi:hypothetical protein